MVEPSRLRNPLLNCKRRAQYYWGDIQSVELLPGVYAVMSIWGSLSKLTRQDQNKRGMVRRNMSASSGKDVIHEFFVYGIQYYLAGRYGVFAGLIPVAANLHHHGIEMLLKGALSNAMTLEELTDLRHNLPKIWREFKKQANDASLVEFDQTIKALSKFDDVRYPDKILQSGASMMFDITRVGAAQSSVTGKLVANMAHYKLCLEEIDELVSEIFRVASCNPQAYLSGRFHKPEARDFLFRDNTFFRPS